MEVTINEMTSTVNAVDGDTLLAPSTLRTIVQVVLEAVKADEDHRDRVRTEQCIGSVRDQQTAHDAR